MAELKNGKRGFLTFAGIILRLPNMSITVSGLTKIYGAQKALDGVTLDIRPGGITGLLGPNGAGKSTLMKILTCFIPASSGTATVCGFDVSDQSIEVRRKVGYLPENNPLYPDLYVKEFLGFIAGMHGMGGNKSARVTEMIGVTGLQSEQHKKIGALSKGYRQRVGLAQAMIHDPEVLILDEPTSGLDPNQLFEIRNLITDLGRTRTVMMSTHIMQEVEAICNRAVIIHQGRIVADDSTQNLQGLSASRAVIRVEFGVPVQKSLILKIPGVLDATPFSAIRDPASAAWSLSSLPDTDIRADVFRFAVENNLTVLSLHREEQRLEEVFQELTRS
jgi:ABC-2 type transport system ATP-binding protein